MKSALHRRLLQVRIQPFEVLHRRRLLASRLTATDARVACTARKQTTCTACARLSELNSGFAGMWTRNWQANISSLVRPGGLVAEDEGDRRPSICAARAAARAHVEHLRRPLARPRRQRERRRRSPRSLRPGCRAPSLLQHVGGVRRHPLRLRRRIALGATRRRSARPMVFIARAAAPMLPGWLGRHRTMRMSLAHSRRIRAPMHPMLNIAVRAARRAGSIINRAALDGDALKVKAKQRQRLRHRGRPAPPRRRSSRSCARPIPTTASSPRNRARTARRRRVPLDHRSARRHHQLHPRLPAVLRVDRASQQRGALAQAVVYDPAKNELFTASKGAAPSSTTGASASRSACACRTRWSAPAFRSRR